MFLHYGDLTDGTTLRRIMVEADLKALGQTSPNGNGVQLIKDLATSRQELGSLHF